MKQNESIRCMKFPAHGDATPKGRRSRDGSDNNQQLLLLTCVLLDAIAFVIDVSLPAEYAVGTLYVGATLLSFWLSSRRAIAALVILGTLLLIFGYLYSPVSPAFGTTETIINRGIAVLVIWWSGGLAIAHHSARVAFARSEASLRANEARTRSILDTAPEALITMDEHGVIDSFSRSAENLFGYDATEVIGKNVENADAVTLS